MKDRIVSWYIRKILVPKIEEIDKPGFVMENLARARLMNIVLRQVFLPEKILIDLEEKMVKKFDNVGKNVLYSIGKKFGYFYSHVSNFPTFRNDKNFMSFLDYTIKYIETTYAGKINYTLKDKIISFKMKDYIICSRNGIGYLFSSGGIAGIWAYVTQDPKVEAVKPKCQGRGDRECEVISATYENLVKIGYKPMKCTDIVYLKGMDNRYEEINKIALTNWAKKSLKTLIDSGFIKYKHGQIIYHNERFFEFEINFMYIIEKELSALKGASDVLWNVSFEWGKELANEVGKQEPVKFIMDFFPALGFGDILVKKNPWKVMVNYFPWTRLYEEVNFVMFRGMISGLICGLTGNVVRLEKTKKTLYNKGFSITFEE